MTRNPLVLLAAAALVLVPLSACASGGADSAADSVADTQIGGDVIAPVTTSVNELQGATVELVVGQVLNINTDSLAVDSYRGEVADPAVAEFIAGHSDGSAEFNPGVEALATGSTRVTLINDQGGIQPLEFTVKVSARE